MRILLGLIFVACLAFALAVFVIAPIGMHHRCKEKGAVAVQGLGRWYCVKEFKED